ncbi:NblA/ycf18 family protein [Ancylothrix sp. C2]|uniref:NblA/ycf18 family protein n=1 Tax=Ancylothrix sp. D3o TaxID=2953691 RepID=UPI0021BB1299|nr:NblA/ycf18 family protein [Ancylothrix sp. D3o]MCT7950846.1 NblA/ycf18 family protein [Ancylothrix sp. D3o]
MELPTQLTLEQEFKMQILREQVKNLSREQAQDYLIEVLKQNMVKDNLFKHFLKKAA